MSLCHLYPLTLMFFFYSIMLCFHIFKTQETDCVWTAPRVISVTDLSLKLKTKKKD